MMKKKKKRTNYIENVMYARYGRSIYILLCFCCACYYCFFSLSLSFFVFILLLRVFFLILSRCFALSFSRGLPPISRLNRSNTVVRSRMNRTFDSNVRTHEKPKRSEQTHRDFRSITNDERATNARANEIEWTKSDKSEGKKSPDSNNTKI